MESILSRLTGSAFHGVGAATLKDLSPKDVFIFPAGCNRIVPELERSEKMIEVVLCVRVIEM